MSDTREPATVDYVRCGEEDHGILTSTIGMKGQGWGQGFGGLALEPEHLEAWKADLCALFQVEDIDQIKGRNCFVLRSWASWGFDIEGLEVDGRRFTLTGFRRKLWPGKSWSPLGAEEERIRDRIASFASRIADGTKDLARVREGYVDWTPALEPGGGDPP